MTGAAPESAGRVRSVQALGDNWIHLYNDPAAPWVVDPGHAAPALQALGADASKPGTVLVTHHHADHTGGVEEFRRLGWQVVGPDDPRIPYADVAVRGGEGVRLGDLELRVLPVPGHTRTHVAFHAPALPAVFTGDALFECGCGRVFEGTPAQMWNSLCRLRELPGDTAVYCGHDYTRENLEFAVELDPKNAPLAARMSRLQASAGKGRPDSPPSIDLERRTNPFLRCDEPALAEAVVESGAAPADVFAVVRKRKDAW